ncbi:hypothetical protein Hanom_Chr06g00558901 [Helianthus anomalus]
MSLTIFPSLTTIFSGGGHHSSPHPTISPQSTIPLTNPNHHGVNFSTRYTFKHAITRYVIWWRWEGHKLSRVIRCIT